MAEMVLMVKWEMLVILVFKVLMASLVRRDRKENVVRTAWMDFLARTELE